MDREARDDDGPTMPEYLRSDDGEPREWETASYDALVGWAGRTLRRTVFLVLILAVITSVGFAGWDYAGRPMPETQTYSPGIGVEHNAPRPDAGVSPRPELSDRMYAAENVSTISPRGPNVTESQINVTELERWIVAYSNAERAARGVEPVVENPDLSTVARNKSKQMALEDTFDHYIDGWGFEEQWFDAGYECEWGGENIAWRDNTLSSPVIANEESVDERAMGEGFVRLFMTSASHRHLLLNPTVNVIGVGVYVERPEPNAMEIWVTQHYCAQTADFDAEVNGTEMGLTAPRAVVENTSKLPKYNASEYPETVTPFPTPEEE